MEFLLNNYLTILAVIVAAATAFALKKIDFIGAAAGVVLSLLILYTGKNESLLSLFIFFIAGTAASSLKKETKKRYRVAQENEGRRTVSNVLGNGGAGFIFCLTSIFFSVPTDETIVLISASFAAACSDTFSSEFGTVYGKKFVSIINFKSSKRGKDGAISLEGILFGLLGSLLVSCILLVYQRPTVTFLAVTTAGILGNIADSVFGAVFQKRGLINNHQVNFLATLTGGLSGLLLYKLF